MAISGIMLEIPVEVPGALLADIRQKGAANGRPYAFPFATFYLALTRPFGAPSPGGGLCCAK